MKVKRPKSRAKGNLYNGPRKQGSAGDSRIKESFVHFFSTIWQVTKFVFAVSLGTAVTGALSVGLIFGYIHLVNSPYFEIKHVVLKGLNRLNQTEVLELTALNKPANILTVRLGVMGLALKGHAWVKDVSLTRKVPDTIIVEIIERKPLAILDFKNKFYVDEEAIPFKRVQPGEDLKLPVITGITRMQFLKEPEATKKYIKIAFGLLNILKKRSDQFRPENIAELNLDEARGVTVFTRDQVEVKVGFGKFEEKFNRLGRVLALLKIRGQEKGLVYINLECGPKVIIRRAA